jgi:hypothetical protein
MSVLINSYRFGGFKPTLQVRTANDVLIAPAGAKSARLWALAAGGRGRNQGNTLFAGGGGEMRSGLVTSVPPGGSLTCIVGAAATATSNGSGTSWSQDGSPIMQANSPFYYSGSGGTDGYGGTGKPGGSGNSVDVTQAGGADSAGGGSGGTDGGGDNGRASGYTAVPGARGAGRSFTDTLTGVTYQNGSGNGGYGGGAGGGDYLGGFAAVEWLGVELLQLVRAMSSNYSVVVPSWATKASLFLMYPGGYAGEYTDNGEDYYPYGGSGGYMYMRDIAVTPGQALTYDSDAGTGGSWKLNGSGVINSGVFDRRISGGSGQDYGSFRGGGAAGTNGPGQGYQRGPGRSFTDAVSGQTFQNGDGGQNYGGGQNYSDGAMGVGFGAVVFSSL